MALSLSYYFEGSVNKYSDHAHQLYEDSCSQKIAQVKSQKQNKTTTKYGVGVYKRFRRDFDTIS